MNKDQETIRITLSLGFITAFLALFFGADFISENRLVFGLKIYAFASSALFFLYLLFTSIKYRYNEEKVSDVGIGFDKIQFKNEEVDKFRRWSFDAGVNFVFAGIFAPFYIFLFSYTDSLKTVFAIILVGLIFEFFFLALQSFFKTYFLKAILFTIITFVIFIFTGFVNSAARKMIEVRNDMQPGLIFEQGSIVTEDEVTFFGALVNFVAGESSLGI